jgi:hypothetical protein
MEQPSHPHVRHPRDILAQHRRAKKHNRTLLYYNELVLEWITNHVLASVVLFDAALIVPLLAIPGPDTIKITLGVISGSWIQLWALPALQRSQNKTQAQNDAKADVDHDTLTYLAMTQDKQTEQLKAIIQVLADPKKK